MDLFVDNARTFALEAHGSIGQTYGGQDYSVHLEAVYELVCLLPFDRVLRAGAWLHDTMEDVPEMVTFEVLKAKFDLETAQLVREVSKVSTKSDGNRAQRMALDRMHLASISDRGQTLKLADTTANLRGVRSLGLDFARVYVPEKALLLPVLDRGHRLLRQLAQEALEDAQRYLQGAR